MSSAAAPAAPAAAPASPSCGLSGEPIADRPVGDAAGPALPVDARAAGSSQAGAAVWSCDGSSLAFVEHSAPPIEPARETLRARKRRETRAAIERAALSLVEERGYDNVTVAQISERAMVSQGTFFNYFPTKDAAIVGVGPVALDQAAVHAAYDRLAPCTPYRATLTLFLKVVRDLDWTSDIAAQRARIVTSTPALMRMFLDSTFEFVSEFRSMLASYLERNLDRRTCADELTAAEEAGLVVSEALEAAKFALARAAADPGAELPAPAEVQDVVRKIVG